MIQVLREKDAAGIPLVDMPSKSYEADGGWDLYMKADLTLLPRTTDFIRSGYHIILPEGWTGLVRPRSSAYMRGLNANATIDAGYTGELMIGIENRSMQERKIYKGERIVQLIPVWTGAGLSQIFQKLEYQGRSLSWDTLAMFLLAAAGVREIDELPETPRGHRGFGSSGD